MRPKIKKVVVKERNRHLRSGTFPPLPGASLRPPSAASCHTRTPNRYFNRLSDSPQSQKRGEPRSPPPPGTLVWDWIPAGTDARSQASQPAHLGAAVPGPPWRPGPQALAPKSSRGPQISGGPGAQGKTRRRTEISKKLPLNWPSEIRLAFCRPS